MDSTEFVEFKLSRIEPATHDTKLLSYTITPEGRFRKLETYPVSFCVQLRTPLGDLVRPYTPISQDDTSLQFIIKAYDQGKMSQFLCNQKLGDNIAVLGPLPTIKYTPNEFKKIGMICGGTGVTPMFQILKEMFRDSDEPATEVTMLYSSRTEHDIVLRNSLLEMAKNHPKRFHLHLVVSEPSSSWQGIAGKIHRSMIAHYLHSPQEPKSIIMVCGPPSMMEDLAGRKNPDRTQGPLKGVLKELGFTESQVYKF
eukprot:Protomagalhaensia_sp_Gyna_25__282@NODE_1132_length_2155_cov_111_949905_g307_i3_p1_GENE_NODE_1132_length_2155_cov_111_949905_g307_i3NODE_1132_length_2155_cov_111_949905_g307_i3_p1_ORF_typecomplete_len254_score29_52NAD_binding_1/PF00175_21/1e28FAD_binding_6/PF00970_24/2_9e14NAD_binding_6/PF08030_12/3_6e10_NODE_1132_length_2155_cov_111_949905_g307_i33631124